MKITKFVHSCLLVETPEIRALIDPGRYSYESRLLNLARLKNLDYIVITHEHGDHYDVNFLRQISKHFPHAAIVTNNDLATKIANLHLQNKIQSGSDENLTVFEAEHEPLPLELPIPLNIGVHLKDKFTHPGDALDIKRSREILALPVSAPGWVNLRIALDAAIKLKPKKIIPVHDWHWHQKARREQYARVKEWLKPHKIEFIELENAEPVEL